MQMPEYSKQIKKTPVIETGVLKTYGRQRDASEGLPPVRPSGLPVAICGS